MSAVVEAVQDVGGAIIEGVGDVVEGVGDVLKDVGKAVDRYIIQPIKQDPLTAIATIGAATFLGPAAASMFGTSAAVGVGIAAGGANTLAGLVQGEDFGTAIKGGLLSGVTAGGIASLTGGAGAEGPVDPLDKFLAENNNFSNVQVNPGADVLPGLDANIGNFTGEGSTWQQFGDGSGLNIYDDASTISTGNMGSVNSTVSPELADGAVAQPIPAPKNITNELDALSNAGPSGGAQPGTSGGAQPSPLQSVSNPAPGTSPSGLSELSLNDYAVPKADLTSGIKPTYGIRADSFTPSDTFNIYGEANYGVVPTNVTGGPGLQLPDSPYLSTMRGGTGLTVPVEGMEQFAYSPKSLDFAGTADLPGPGSTGTWVGENGQIYGNASPDGTISARGFTPEQPTMVYGNENIGEMGAWDKAMSGDVVGAAKDVGSQAWEYAKEHPWYTAGGVLAADMLLNRPKPPQQPEPAKGKTRDANFTKSLDLYQYVRDRANYQGDLTKYGQAGQGGEQNFFQNTKFVPIPITTAKMGGLIQMKKFAAGGQAQGMQMDPRRAQLMAAMAQQHPAGGGQMRPPMQRPQGGMPQGGMMPGRPMVPQNGQGLPTQQGAPMQGGQMPGQRPPMQRPRDPKTAYYQYGTPPAQAKAMGGLSQVHSMRIGGGADGRSDDVNAVLSDGEYVMDAETVAMLGNGSSKAGAKKLDDMRAKLRQHKGKALAHGKISPDAKSPLAYLKGA